MCLDVNPPKFVSKLTKERAKPNDDDNEGFTSEGNSDSDVDDGHEDIKKQERCYGKSTKTNSNRSSNKIGANSKTIKKNKGHRKNMLGKRQEAKLFQRQPQPIP